jgi:hypothetical protein
MQAALQKVRTSLAALKTSDGGQWGGQWGRPGHPAGRGYRGLPDERGRVDGDSLLSVVPTIVSDLKQIDTAWKALQQQIDKDC